MGRGRGRVPPRVRGGAPEDGRGGAALTRPLVLAHRGFHAEHPENTVAAFRAGLALGADGVETDVRRSADGAAVLFHDRHVADGRPVASLPRDELSRAAGFDVPSLDEALAALPEDAAWDVELKSADSLGPAVDALRPHVGRRAILVTSFRHDVLRDLAERLPQVELGLLLASRPVGLAGSCAAAWTGHRRMRTVVWDYEVLDERLVAECRAVGLRTWVWGMRTAAEHARAAALGVDAVVTDDPRLAR